VSDAELEAQRYPKAQFLSSVERAVVDFDWVHREVRRPGVTLQLSWSEYVQAAQRSRAEPCQYSQFCARYIAWRSKLDLVMRQVHRAGEKGFIDYSGKKPKIYDAATGQEREVELFVVTLGASNYTFAEATLTQKVDFIDSITRGLEFFGGVPEVLAPDQLRSAVSAPEALE
jgi:transposase